MLRLKVSKCKESPKGETHSNAGIKKQKPLYGDYDHSLLLREEIGFNR